MKAKRYPSGAIMPITKPLPFARLEALAEACFRQNSVRPLIDSGVRENFQELVLARTFGMA